MDDIPYIDGLKIKKAHTKRITKELDKQCLKKSTLTTYMKYKRNFSDGLHWTNNFEVRIGKFFDANVILTRDKTSKDDDDKKCPHCKTEENLEHIISDCKLLQNVRDRHSIHMCMDDFFEKRNMDMDFKERSNWYLKDVYINRFRSWSFFVSFFT